MSADPSLTPPPSLPPWEQLVAIVMLFGGAIAGLVKLLFRKGRNGKAHTLPPAPADIDIESLLKEAATMGAITATVEATKDRLEAGLEEIKHLRERADGFQETIRRTKLDAE